MESAATQADGSDPQPAEPTAGGGSVLLIDDSASDRFLYERLLSTAGAQYRVFKARDLEQGLSYLDSERPDCVLLDYWLEDKTGLAFMEELERRGADIPVVLLTSSTDEDVARAAYSSGVREVLRKSGVTVESLHETIARVSTGREQASNSGPAPDEMWGEAGLEVSGEPEEDAPVVPVDADARGVIGDEAGEAADALAGGMLPDAANADAPGGPAVPELDGAPLDEGPDAFGEVEADPYAEVFSAYFEAQPDLCLLVEASSQAVARVNAAGLRKWGIPVHEANAYFSQSKWQSAIRNAADGTPPFRMSMRTPAGRNLPVELHIVPLTVGGTDYRMIQVRDLSALAQAKARIKALMEQGEPRGAASWHQFEVALARGWAQGVESGQAFGVLLIEVAAAAAIRDEWGTVARERWMAKCEQALRGVLKSGGRIVRLDYDRFGMVVAPGQEHEDAAEIADSFVAAVSGLELPQRAPDEPFHVGCAAAVPSMSTPPSQVVDAAERALVEARREGRLLAGGLAPAVD